jgi:hypothetical protein
MPLKLVTEPSVFANPETLPESVVTIESADFAREQLAKTNRTNAAKDLFIAFHLPDLLQQSSLGIVTSSELKARRFSLLRQIAHLLAILR